MQFRQYCSKIGNLNNMIHCPILVLYFHSKHSGQAGIIVIISSYSVDFWDMVIYALAVMYPLPPLAA